jgi:hypothetical protein
MNTPIKESLRGTERLFKSKNLRGLVTWRVV